MADAQLVKQQLKKVGADAGLLYRAEHRELPHILFDQEQIINVINGTYSGGLAILCATDKRILLVDKKPFYMTMEDVRYDMISDVMFNNRLLNSTLLLGTMHKSITFKSFNQTRIRNFTSFVQQKVMEVRTSHHMYPTTEQAMQQQIGAFGTPVKQVRNPYNMPVMIRNRANKYY